MPVYTIRNDKTNEEWDVNCSYEELEKLLSTGLERVWKPNAFISQSGSVMSRTDTDFRSHLKSLKKKYPGSTIND
jgi:hypothetical protein